MPGFDGTGPCGVGPMTGGGRGFCAVPMHPVWPAYNWTGFPIPYTTPRGMPYLGAPSFAPEITWEEELDYLEGLAKSMSDDLKEIEARIQQIESREEKDKT